MEALITLKKYVDMPSGSMDKQDCEALARILTEDFEAIGMSVTAHPGKVHGPTLICRWGEGPKQLMLMGHYDTVFPHGTAQPYAAAGDWATGSGIGDMKGGIAVMLHALKVVLPALDPAQHALVAVLNGDEEVGSEESRGHILAQAERSLAALSFEPGHHGRLTVERKGVTCFELRCTGIGGHAGSFYKQGASAIQSLCEAIGRLYALRDDAHDLSLSIGTIAGGTADNVIASQASARGEFRSFDPALLRKMQQDVMAVCAAPAVPGTQIEVTIGASHPACKSTPQSVALFEKASAIARSQGRSLALEQTGGAGDISFAAEAGIPVLDGLGLEGQGYHTDKERANIALMPQNIDLAARLIQQLLTE